MKKGKLQNLVLWVVRKKAPAPFSFQLTKEVKMNWKALPALVVILLAYLASTAYAVPLIASGSHLPPAPLGFQPYDLRAISNPAPGVFEGSWPGTGPQLAQSDWWGTFYATGAGPDPPGITTYDNFTNLALGYLPAGTMFYFGDVDTGSGTIETFTLNAWAPDDSPITGAWLDGPIGVWETGGSGLNGTPVANDMPGWAFNAGEYLIDGTTVIGNPSVGFLLQSNVAIGTLRVDENGPWGANFYLAAPAAVPEPMTILLLGSGLIGLAGLARLKR